MRVLVQNVGYLCLICVVIDKHDHTLSGEDHLTECRPLAAVLRHIGGFVEIRGQTRVLDGVDVIGHGNSICPAAVADQDSHNIVGMILDPICHLCELGLICACVEKITACMASIHGTIDELSFTLDHSDAVVELSRNAILLVAGCIVLDGESRVVGANLGDVRVLARTKLGIAIARRGVAGEWCGAGRA